MNSLRSPIYVWQLPVRLFHWINALAITILFITGLYIAHPVLAPQGEATLHFVMGRVRFWHGITSFVFSANLMFRAYWFWAGNDYARFGFWRPGFLRDALKTVRYYCFISKEHSLNAGHNSIAQLMYFIFVWLGGCMMILTGLTMRGGGDPQGIWQSLLGWIVPGLGGEYQVRSLHRLISWGFSIFVLGHLYMVFRQDILDDDGTVSSMLNGYKFELVNSEGIKKDDALNNKKSHVK
ncbi:Ni/Fe-hydrogenase, b-type cytochrome subunit [Desulfosporosinus sp. Sb-LF]|uniref:Ni/Fe-hydrogenase, b-type cytochrome subunit n=1 Tax=Desulfosporosinus sp. Sb-LF TaxID=2560027 RepID=UPI00107F8DBD|nr:Ni/Fe-hydrogenase, b-type cytochrome subunit [Desulfosporosinus sp. Sb-LF]TGE33384.1 Ni/Fe-hydrogenase, b-type cytochrome subunit [Desulfosporosinus sp. Sb-LF]